MKIEWNQPNTIEWNQPDTVDYYESELTIEFKKGRRGFDLFYLKDVGPSDSSEEEVSELVFNLDSVRTLKAACELFLAKHGQTT